ncbi:MULTISPECIES: DUF305 domain-containing protein [unclassified Actinoplanes]|uniref:DUF305 domain-containing protein n=1 Tax=unclassified Actinoplanes TaxID=2626549 RepID=UPI000693B66D|nr:MULTISPECIES: DUF305 domain-containing protein [unclassified Actinoplanes]
MRRHVVAGALLLSLAACGTAPSAPAPSTPSASAAAAGATFNARDVMFLQMMVDHQQQGLRLAAIGAGRASRPDVANLARAVDLTETDELTMMKSWLTGWGRSTQVDKRVSVHADHGGLPSTTDAEIESLKTVKKADFETAFLNLFLAHQHNAVEMAQLELDTGANEQTRQFAERVKESRADQVQQMLRLLNG